MRDQTKRLLDAFRDVRLAFALIIGMFLAGVVLPLASPERDTAIEAGDVAEATPGASADSSTDAEGSAGVQDGSVTSVAGDGSAGTVDAGTGPGSQGGVNAAAAADGASVARTASDRGVTASTIKLGVALADLDALSRTGLGASNGTVAERTKVWEALVAQANEQGGAGGRKIELFVDSFSPIDQNAAAAACQRLAEDRDVFAIISDVGWIKPAVACATRQYGLPNIGYDAQDLDTYAQSGGLLFTQLASNERMLYNEVLVNHERGLLKGKTIGLVSTEGQSDAPDRTEIPTLKSLGYAVAHRSVLSRDLSTAQSQIPVEIQQMRSKGVDFILFGGGPALSNIWINQAQKTAFNPTYSFSDFASGTADFSVQSVSQQVDAYAWATRRVINRRGSGPKAKSDEACTQRAKAGSGIDMPYESDLYWNTVEFCAHLRAFVDATGAAGVNPTRAAVASALAGLGQRHDLEVGPNDVGGSWRPGKFDAADYIHLARHDLSCRCFRPEGDWFPMKPLPR